MQNLIARLWFRQRWSTYLGLLITATVFLLCFPTAGQTAEDKFPPSPLEITTPDPLLPKESVDRPFTPQERQALIAALDRLNVEAAEQLKAGNPVVAFEIWNRELRLRRSLGTLEEIQALGRVGDIAWNNNQKYEVQIITKRLQAIQNELLNPKKPQKKRSSSLPPAGAEEIRRDRTVDEEINITPSPVSSSHSQMELLQALAQAYQQVRVPGSALEIYQLILADARQRQDKVAEETILKTTADLHMSWFDYPQAAATYEELLNFATQKGDRVQEVVYLKQLAYIYDKMKQPENSLKAKQRLLESYVNDPQQATQIPAMKIAIADDYQALKPPQPDAASQNYQEAYNLAWSLQQFAAASEALKKLGDLYRTYKQPEYALQVYEVLLQVEQQSYDYYSLMNTYDQIGQIHLEQGDSGQALVAFQQGLELAKSLQYQETYFANQIERVTKQDSP